MQLGRAFSLRRNARALFAPPPEHLRPLDGLRAVAILWVMTFHAGWYAAGSVAQGTYVRLLLARWMLPVWRGDFGVDLFFVISGFLIAGLLVDERARTGRLRLGLFTARRLVRLWPALVVAVALDVVLVGDHPEMAWANLLYVSNFVPIASAAMGWTWSLAIEEQFYLLCPWLVLGLARLQGPSRAAVLAALGLSLCAAAAYVVVDGGFLPFDAEIVLNRDLGRWAAGFDALYTKPWMRAGPLVAGVAAAYVYRAPRAMEALARHRAAAGAGLAAAVALAAASTHWQLFETAPRAAQVLYLASFRTAFGVAMAYVTLLSLSRHPVGRALGRALGSRALHPIAQVSYSAYLLNPLVATEVHRALGPHVGSSPVATLAAFLPCDAAATLLAAAALHLAVERPFMQLRPGGPR